MRSSLSFYKDNNYKQLPIYIYGKDIHYYLYLLIYSIWGSAGLVLAPVGWLSILVVLILWQHQQLNSTLWILNYSWTPISDFIWYTEWLQCYLSILLKYSALTLNRPWVYTNNKWQTMLIKINSHGNEMMKPFRVHWLKKKHFFTDLKFSNVAIYRTEIHKWNTSSFFPNRILTSAPWTVSHENCVTTSVLGPFVGTWLCAAHPKAASVCACPSSFPFLPPCQLSFHFQHTLPLPSSSQTS